ncbi:MAG: IS66 family transposase [Chloroflexota bacterium]|nr:MAG: IS66 family transposase [Chloroflexota bacterium]
MRRPTWDELYRVVERLTADREAERAESMRLRAMIAQQAARIEQLEGEVARWRGQGGGGAARGRIDLSRPPRPSRQQGPRRRRPEAFVRRWSDPTEERRHAVDACPDCGCALKGGSVKRWRETIEIEPRRASVTAHGLVERRCPRCHRRCVPRLAETGMNVGKQRFGPRLTALIVSRRDDGRMPVRVIQRQIQTVWDLHISLGAIVRLLHVVATRGQPAVAALRASIRASPAVHADETHWREDGAARSLWVTATADACAYAIGRRTNAQIDDLIGADYPGVLITDFYAAYNHFGVHQRCWAHLIREMRDLTAQFPEDIALGTWVQHIRRLYQDARAAVAEPERRRASLRRHLQARIVALCSPYGTADVPQRRLAARLATHPAELFTFVTEPHVPPTNNRAERDLRPLVIARKIFGGTRSAQGSADAVTRWSLLATWRRRHLNPFIETQQLLLSPQL